MGFLPVGVFFFMAAVVGGLMVYFWGDRWGFGATVLHHDFDMRVIIGLHYGFDEMKINEKLGKVMDNNGNQLKSCEHFLKMSFVI